MAEADRPVLVTGGTGFIGSYVVKALLESGRRVIALDVRGYTPEGRFLLGGRADEVVVEEGSVDDWVRVLHVVNEHRPWDVIHLATITNPVYLFTNPMPGVRVNFLGTIHMLEAARLFDIRRIVYFSSIGVLPAKQYEPIDAAHPIFLPREAVPTGVYGASKIAGEAFCFAYNQAFGTDFRTIRPSAVYGFGMQWPIFVKPMVEGAVRGRSSRSSRAGRSRATTHTPRTWRASRSRSSTLPKMPTASSTGRRGSRSSPPPMSRESSWSSCPARVSRLRTP